MVSGRSYEEVLEQYFTYGFEPSIIKMAWDTVKGDETKLLDEIYRMNKNNSTITKHAQEPASIMEEQAIIDKAIQESLDDAKAKNISFEPLNPQQRLRKTGVPVGLKNVGNTCYFNSLLQAYFYNTSLVHQVLSFVEPTAFKGVRDDEKCKDPQIKRKIASIQLVKNLQLLFAGMISSDKKYLDPTNVITSIVDDYGNEIPIGDQKDIGEFNLYFLSRVEEGISLQDKYNQNRMQVEEKQVKEEGDQGEFSSSKIGFLGQHNSQDSLLKRSSIKVTSESTIGKEFFGKMETTFLNQKEGIKKIEDEMFTLLFVNVHHKELYTAFEEAIYSVIDDYRNEKGEVVTVEKQTWIKEPPKTLFFQIERVLFDKQTKNLKKIHDTFDFPKEFYIDPFLESNKEKSLQIRKDVTLLRKRKVQLLESLSALENYNDTNLSMSRILTETMSILSIQNSPPMEVEGQEFPNPLLFTEVNSKLPPQTAEIFLQLIKVTESRVGGLKSEIQKLENEIEKAYKTIRATTPYKLQSILIHEGQADSGHYFSYSYDQEFKVWRKYNDINVTEETEQQVIKLAKGSGVTSAYYLVYTQHPEVELQDSPLRTYKLSTDEGYGNNVYSNYIPKETIHQVNLDNQQLYHDIQTHKAGGFISKVIDNYIKRFEACNELSRKMKASENDKKKNSPPILINLPVYIKSVGGSDDEYKAALIHSSRLEFGPKEEMPVFDEILTNKFVNLNDFKRPKFVGCKEQYHEDFLRGIMASLVMTEVYRCIQNQEWEKVASGLTLARERFSKGNAAAGNQDYFTWMMNALTRLILLLLLNQVERYASEKEFEKGLRLARVFGGFFSLSLHLLQDKNILIHMMVWICEISIPFPEVVKPEMEVIQNAVSQKNRMPEFEPLITEGYSLFLEKLGSVDIRNQEFNFSRQEDTLIKDLVQAQQGVSNIMKMMNDLLKQMKRTDVPFTKVERGKYLK